MKLAITDANIFIDLFHVGLIDELFLLEIELYTSLEVIFELEDHQQESLLTIERLTVLSNSDPNYLEDLEDSLSQRLSLADLSIFHHARDLEAGILTGDSLLKKISKKYGFEVHGILWLFDVMLNMNHLSTENAISKLKALMDFNKHLPISDCQKMISKWSE